MKKIEIIIRSDKFHGKITIPEKKFVKYLKEIYKDYIKTMTENSYMNIQINKI
jgi:hypothetical protein